MRAATVLFLLVVIPALWGVGSPSQTYSTFTSTIVYSSTQASLISIGEVTLTQLTTSAYGIATGTIPASITDPATGQQICYYVPYHFQASQSVGRVVGTVSGSSPLNFYLMSQAQYNDFVAKNLPCGSSYSAITLDYLKSTFTVDFSPTLGDYYILLENISGSTITYTIQISAIGTASSTLYGTTEVLQVVTSYASQTYQITTQPVTTPQPTATTSGLVPVAIAIVVLVALLALSWSRRRRKKEAPTRVY